MPSVLPVEPRNGMSLPVEQIDEFRERPEGIMESSSGIGWGYHDELRQDFYEAFPEDEQQRRALAPSRKKPEGSHE